MQIGNIQGRTHRLPATRSACPRNGSDPDGRSRRELTSAGWRRVSLPVAAGREREIDEEHQRHKPGMATQARDWPAPFHRGFYCSWRDWWSEGLLAASRGRADGQTSEHKASIELSD